MILLISQDKREISTNIDLTKNESTLAQAHHEDRLKDSLDNALSAMLSQNSSSFPSKTSKKTARCFLCEKLASLFDIAYKAPCSHIVCRECVTKITSKSIHCSVCNQDFPKSDLIREHNLFE